MRKLVIVAIAASLAVSPATAQPISIPPVTITVDRLDCAPPSGIGGSAYMVCWDEQDGVRIDIHNRGGETWLAVYGGD